MRISATACARQITGSAPYFCCSGCAMLSANEYEVIAMRIRITPIALLRPSFIAGSAISTVPAIPTISPITTLREGNRRLSADAVIVPSSGPTPFNIPVSADDTRSSA